MSHTTKRTSFPRSPCFGPHCHHYRTSLPNNKVSSSHYGPIPVSNRYCFTWLTRAHLSFVSLGHIWQSDMSCVQKTRPYGECDYQLSHLWADQTQINSPIEFLPNAKNFAEEFLNWRSNLNLLQISVLCKLCNSEPEIETHFLFKCEKFNKTWSSFQMRQNCRDKFLNRVHLFSPTIPNILHSAFKTQLTSLKLGVSVATRKDHGHPLKQTFSIYLSP